MSRKDGTEMGAARDRWLDAGVEVLTEEGAAGVRIDRLAARLGLSKGSFHHHFAGAEGYKGELLDHLESLLTDSLKGVIAEVEDEPTARRAVARLIEIITPTEDENALQAYSQRLETALRAWALSDPEAARTQARIDEARVEALSSLWRRFSDNEADVRLRALLPYVLGLGATVIMPPLSTGEVTALFEAILPLVPDAAPHEDAAEPPRPSGRSSP